MTNRVESRPGKILPLGWIFATAAALLLIAWVLVRGVALHNDVARRRAALLADLSRLSEAEEDALARDGHYAAHLALSGGVDTAVFRPSPDVQVRFELLGEGSWRAVVTDTVLAVEPRHCGIFRGDIVASPHRAVVRPGIPACW